MKKKAVKKTSLKKLKRCRIKDIGVCEKIGLIISGCRDGKNGLPYAGKNGLTSPFIEKEIHSFQEFSVKIWSLQEEKEEASYIILGDLEDKIHYIRACIKEAEKELCSALDREENTDFYSRKDGESRLSESEVNSRRLREKDARLAGYRDKITSLQSELESIFKEFFSIKNRISEEENMARLLSKKIEEHVYQRLCVYCEASLKNSKKAEVSGLYVNLKSIGEETYIKSHEGLMKNGNKITELFNEYEKEEA